MNYDHPKLKSSLAAEYVLGTLRGQARQRFKRLLSRDAALRGEVEYWERHFNALAAHTPPIMPPERVWENIEKAISPPQTTQASGFLWNCLNFWRPVGIFSSLAALGLAVYLALGQPQETTLTTLAVLNNQQAKPTWVIMRKQQGAEEQLAIKVMAPQHVDPTKAFELWAIPAQGAPMSLGLLPMQGSMTMSVSEKARQMLPTAIALAISMEPAGGSPTGSPTGPVISQGQLVSL